MRTPLHLLIQLHIYLIICLFIYQLFHLITYFFPPSWYFFVYYSFILLLLYEWIEISFKVWRMNGHFKSYTM